jgi:uncharacterized membrane protein
VTTTARKLISGKRLERLEALSDGVIAIAITLLVLDIAVPEGAGSDLLQAVLDLWPSYLAYAISVVTIGVLWIAHSSMTGLLSRADSVILRFNLLFLALVSFIPFPTRLVADFLTETDAERAALTVYALVLLATNISLALVWRWAARRRRLIRDDVSDDEIAQMNDRITPSIWIYLVAVVAAIFLPVVALALFFASAIWLALPAHARPRLSGGRR